MDPDDIDFVEAAEMEAQKRGALLQMEEIDDKIVSVMQKLIRLDDMKEHLKTSYDSQFRKIERGGQYVGSRRPSDVEFNSTLTATVKDKADRLEAAVNNYVNEPLDPILEGINTEGLKREICVLIDLIDQVLGGDPIFDFPSLVRAWEPLSLTANQRAHLVRRGLKKRKAWIKQRLFPRVVFLVVFLMEPEGREEVYRDFVHEIEKGPEMTLLIEFAGLVREAHWRCCTMPNLRRITRNILECYSPMAFPEGEVSKFLGTIIDRMEQMDIVLRDIPQRRPGDCIFRQLEWGGDMMLRCEELVKSVFEQMDFLYGPCFREWDSVMVTWTRAALAT